MKKMFSFFLIMFCLFVTNSNAKNLAIFNDNFTVTEYGFLNFPDTKELGEFLIFCTENTHKDVQEYLNARRVSTLGHKKFENEDLLGQKVKSEEAVYYILSSEGVFQIKNIIIKPITPSDCEISPWSFILTITNENLNKETYELLIKETFDSKSMNKFATNSLQSKRPLFDIIEEQPFGYEDTQKIDCPVLDKKEANNNQISASRFLGIGWHRGPKHGPLASSAESGCPCGGWAHTDDFTIFWIHVCCTQTNYECAPCTN